MTDDMALSAFHPVIDHSILFTGFGPFPGVTVNASAHLAGAAVKAARTHYCDYSFFCTVLPTEWDAGPRSAVDLIARIKPSLVLHFGVAQDCTGLRLETQAVNTCRMATDACGLKPLSSVLAQAGANALAVTIPIHQIAQRLASCGIPVSLSTDAGAYLCNAVLYRSLAYGEAANLPTRIGFIHIPVDLHEQPLAFGDAVAGILEIVATCVGTTPDNGG